MISMICFSQNGWDTGMRIKEALGERGKECTLEGKSRYLPWSIPKSSGEWTKKHWESSEAIVFIGACGIAVRGIAPYVSSKKTDPAVLVVDECGMYVISLLSGHLGGANELTLQLAKILGAQPIVTTATDLNQKFAVDVFAKKNHCAIFPMNAAKEVSAALLAGEMVGFYSDVPWDGALPGGLVVCDRDGSCGEGKLRLGIAVSILKDCVPFEVTVHLVPRSVSLGVGCRKGKEFEALLSGAKNSLSDGGIYREAVVNIASIDLKREEAGLLQLAKEWNLPFITYQADELQGAKGDFQVSEFVKSIAGVDNVCERSAVLASDQGTLIQRKHGADGVTTALAVKKWRLHFE